MVNQMEKHRSWEPRAETVMKRAENLTRRDLKRGRDRDPPHRGKCPASGKEGREWETEFLRWLPESWPDSATTLTLSSDVLSGAAERRPRSTSNPIQLKTKPRTSLLANHIKIRSISVWRARTVAKLDAEPGGKINTMLANGVRNQRLTQCPFTPSSLALRGSLRSLHTRLPRMDAGDTEIC